MGLADTVRAAVAAAATAVDDLLVPVTHEAFTGWSGDKVPTYAAGVTRRGFIERKGTLVQWRVGLEVIEADMLTLLGNIVVDQHDRITFPDGAQPPVLEVRGVRDPSGGVFYTQVVFGRPEKGVTAQ